MSGIGDRARIIRKDCDAAEGFDATGVGDRTRVFACHEHAHSTRVDRGAGGIGDRTAVGHRRDGLGIVAFGSRHEEGFTADENANGLGLDAAGIRDRAGVFACSENARRASLDGGARGVGNRATVGERGRLGRNRLRRGTAEVLGEPGGNTRLARLDAAGVGDRAGVFARSADARLAGPDGGAGGIGDRAAVGERGVFQFGGLDRALEEAHASADEHARGTGLDAAGIRDRAAVGGDDRRLPRLWRVGQPTRPPQNRDAIAIGRGDGAGGGIGDVLGVGAHHIDTGDIRARELACIFDEAGVVATHGDRRVNRGHRPRRGVADRAAVGATDGDAIIITRDDRTGVGDRATVVAVDQHGRGGPRAHRAGSEIRDAAGVVASDGHCRDGGLDGATVDDGTRVHDRGGLRISRRDRCRSEHGLFKHTRDVDAGRTSLDGPGIGNRAGIPAIGVDAIPLRIDGAACGIFDGAGVGHPGRLSDVPKGGAGTEAAEHRKVVGDIDAIARGDLDGAGVGDGAGVLPNEHEARGVGRDLAGGGVGDRTTVGDRAIGNAISRKAENPHVGGDGAGVGDRAGILSPKHHPGSRSDDGGALNVLDGPTVGHARIDGARLVILRIRLGYTRVKNAG